MEDKTRNLLIAGILGVGIWYLYKKGTFRAITSLPTSTTQPEETPTIQPEETTTIQPEEKIEEEYKIIVFGAQNIAEFSKIIPTLADKYNIIIIEMKDTSPPEKKIAHEFYLKVSGLKSNIYKFEYETKKLKGYIVNRIRPIVPPSIWVEPKIQYLQRLKFTAQPIYAPKPHYEITLDEDLIKQLRKLRIELRRPRAYGKTK